MIFLFVFLALGLAQHPNSGNCTTKYISQKVDHFNWLPANGIYSYNQRYLVYANYWKPGGPIFFYTGNEGDVTLYADNTGLMWENAEKFTAYIVFAEHRYYGKSLPFGERSFEPSNIAWLTHEQAMADYVVLIDAIKQQLNAPDVAVIAFGGSYGGMLSAWMRIKYPGSVDGAIAASAPVLAFEGLDPPFNNEAYWSVVTRDASPAAGSPAECAPNVAKAWTPLFQLGQSSTGRQQLASIFKLCAPPANSEDVFKLAAFLKNAWDTLAMGNYPFASSYLTGGQALLPPWPVRAACQYMVGPFTDPNYYDLLAALNLAAGVYNNATGDIACYELPDPQDDGIWDYQWCTEMLPEETYWTCDGVNDMFWPYAYNYTYIQERCSTLWKVTPTPNWITLTYGGRDLPGASNIVFSNGLYDPWSSGGVLTNLSDSVVAVIIEDGAHHVDLMFSNPADTPSMLAARNTELSYISQWVAQKGKAMALRNIQKTIAHEEHII